MDNENRLDGIEERLDMIESKLEELFEHLDLTSIHDEDDDYDYDNDNDDENDDEICDDCFLHKRCSTARRRRTP